MKIKIEKKYVAVICDDEEKEVHLYELISRACEEYKHKEEIDTLITGLGLYSLK